MTIREIEPPVALAVTLEDAKDTLRLEQDDTSLDTLITIWIAGVTGQAEHSTGRSFVNRAMRAIEHGFPDAIRLSSPTFSVESLRFLDTSGEWQTLHPDDYYVDKVSAPGCIVPARGKAWPATADEPNAVEVDYTAGYGADSTATPASARLYILARLAEQWEPASKEFKETVQSAFIGRLLDPLKVYR